MKRLLEQRHKDHGRLVAFADFLRLSGVVFDFITRKYA